MILIITNNLMSGVILVVCEQGFKAFFSCFQKAV